MPKSIAIAGTETRATDATLAKAIRPDGLLQSEYILSLERGFAVVKCFGEENPRRTLAEVARATGLSRGAARRFLLTLQSLGYVENKDRYFSLRPQTLELGYAYLASQPWWRSAQRVADLLAMELGNACAVGVLDGASIVYVAYASAARFSIFNRSIGTRIPAYSTAIGRAILASLSEGDLSAIYTDIELPRLTPFTVRDLPSLKAILSDVKREGYSIVNQE